MPMYALIDDTTHNILGEFTTREEAESLRERLLEADGSAFARFYNSILHRASAPSLRIAAEDDEDAPEEAAAAYVSSFRYSSRSHRA